MADFSEFTTVFRAKVPRPATQKRVTKRNRQPVSCTACRQRKLKCDRTHPCGSCTKRGEISSCDFANVATTVAQSQTESTKTVGAQVRLQRLEEMVTELIGRSHASKDISSGGENDLTPEQYSAATALSEQNASSNAAYSTGGHLDLQGTESNYIGATHWEAILENIRDIQDHLESDSESTNLVTPESLTDPIPDLLFTTNFPLTVDEVLEALPPRENVDRLLGVYFKAKYIILPLLHRIKFQREYDAFWENPESMPFLWMSLLFSLLYIATTISYATDQVVMMPTDKFNPGKFMAKAGQCLLAGQYNKPQVYTLEALLLYSQCRYMQNDDPDTGLCSIMGVVTRMASRMGYHRDPSNLTSKITPFEGEMRRRVWFVVEAFDLLLASQMGIPVLIQGEQCDTLAPHNLFDEDFDEDCEVLPPGRPTTESTPMLYSSYKSGRLRALRLVVNHAMAIKRPTYDETMRLDALVKEDHRGTPLPLRMKPLRQSFTDDPSTMLTRISLELLYLKSQCILHRGYLSNYRNNPEFEYSRKECASAALKILEIQFEVHTESQPGGLLYKDRWMLTSLTFHDFLVAAMITCLDIYESAKHPNGLEEASAQAMKWTALERSYQIWLGRAQISRDAAKASQVLAIMLANVSRPLALQTPPGSTMPSLSTATNSAFNIEPQSVPSSTQDSTPQSMMFVEAPDSNPGIQPVPMAYDGVVPMDTDPLSVMISDPEHFDWHLLDQYLLDRDDFAVE